MIYLTSCENFPAALGRPLRRGGFSLVEVVLAVGIVAFALIAVFGLLPVGLASTQDGRLLEAGTELLTSTADDFRNAAKVTGLSPILKIPVLSSSSASVTLYFSANGVRLSHPQNATLRLVATPRTSDDPNLAIWHLEVAWPAQAASPPNFVETVVLLSR